MHLQHTPVAKRDHNETLHGVERLELLFWRFSQSETHSLSLLQLAHRQRPNVLDLPLDECRMRFVRWLVETGRLNEEVADSMPERPTADGQPQADDGSVLALRERATCTALEGVPSSVQDCEPYLSSPPKAAQEQDLGGEEPGRARSSQPGAGSRVRSGLTKLAAFGRKLGRILLLPDDNVSWGGPYGANNPYSGYTHFDWYAPRSYGGTHASIYDPHWSRFRHG